MWLLSILNDYGIFILCFQKMRRMKCNVLLLKLLFCFFSQFCFGPSNCRTNIFGHISNKCRERKNYRLIKLFNWKRIKNIGPTVEWNFKWIEIKLSAKMEFLMLLSAIVDYQTSHFCTGFIVDPSGHWKSLANSGRLLRGPNTRNWAGECTPVVIRIFIDSEEKNNYLLEKIYKWE